MKDRIVQFLTAERISPAEFADKIGVQRSSMSHILNGRNFPSASFIQKMLHAYSSLNPRWLMIGDGTMYDRLDSGNQVIQPGSEKETNVKEDFVDKSPTLKIASAPVDSLSDEVPKVPGGNLREPEVASTLSQTADNTEMYPPEVSREDRSNEQVRSLGPALQEMPVPLENKEIEQVLFFYKDKTFTVYRPS